MTSATYIFRETTRPEPIRDSALTFLRIYDLLISAGFLYIFASSALIPIGRAIERGSVRTQRSTLFLDVEMTSNTNVPRTKALERTAEFETNLSLCTES